MSQEPIKLKARIQNKYESLENWNKLTKEDNFIPLKGEVCYGLDNNILYQKIGDGRTNFVDLPWLLNQSDQDETNEYSPSYIKNRTHYRTPEIIQNELKYISKLDEDKIMSDKAPLFSINDTFSNLSIEAKYQAILEILDEEGKILKDEGGNEYKNIIPLTLTNLAKVFPNFEEYEDIPVLFSEDFGAPVLISGIKYPDDIYSPDIEPEKVDNNSYLLSIAYMISNEIENNGIKTTLIGPGLYYTGYKYTKLPTEYLEETILDTKEQWIKSFEIKVNDDDYKNTFIPIDDPTNKNPISLPDWIKNEQDGHVYVLKYYSNLAKEDIYTIELEGRDILYAIISSGNVHPSYTWPIYYIGFKINEDGSFTYRHIDGYYDSPYTMVNSIPCGVKLKEGYRHLDIKFDLLISDPEGHYNTDTYLTGMFSNSLITTDSQDPDIIQTATRTIWSNNAKGEYKFETANGPQVSGILVSGDSSMMILSARLQCELNIDFFEDRILINKHYQILPTDYSTTIFPHDYAFRPSHGNETGRIELINNDSGITNLCDYINYLSFLLVPNMANNCIYYKWR